MLCLLCSQRWNSSLCRANQTGPSAMQHVNCRSVDSPGPGGNPRTTLRWSPGCRSALARVAGVAGVSIAGSCVSLGVLCRLCRLHKGLQTENGAMPGDVPAAPTPCSTLQSSAVVPLGICEARFDLNGVQESSWLLTGPDPRCLARGVQQIGVTQPVGPVRRQNKPKVV